MTVPQILQILVNKNSITEDQQNDVMAELRQNPAYKNKFAGEVAVLQGVVTQEQVDAGLRHQSALIAKAATLDIESIIAGKKLIFPPYMSNPHWGNNDTVNAISDPITIDSAASAAANVAKLIVMLIKDTPQFASAAQDGVIAAKNLTNFILVGDNALHPANKLGEWLEKSETAILNAAAFAEVPVEKMESYITNRFAEISKGAEIAQEQSATKAVAQGK